MRRGVLSHIRTADTMRGRRKTVKISEAEWSIMKVLWDGCEKNERGMTLGEIVQELTETTGWSNTTIRTLVIRLSEKGAVDIDKTTGVYKYTPKTSKSDCVKCGICATYCPIQCIKQDAEAARKSQAMQAAAGTQMMTI